MGKTFLGAALALGIVGVAQFSAVGVSFYRSMQAANGGRVVPDRINIEQLIAESPPPRDEELSIQNPLDEPSGPETPPKPQPVPASGSQSGTPAPNDPPPAEPAPTPPQAPPRPTPVPLTAFTPKVDPRMTELVEQGKLLRNSGDTAGALVKLREAGAMAPDNPLPIAEMAYTYEKMSLPDKAAVEWRRILQMGEKAGFYYSAAKSKLDIAVSAARASSGGTGVVGTGGGDFQNGKSMMLGRITVADETGAPGKRFTLSIPILARAGAVTNPRQEVVTQVRFYDQINGKEVVPTNANVAYRFASPPADWADGGTETLEVDYNQPLVGKDDPSGENRRYYGYAVRIYFKGQLQSSIAEPMALIQKFPEPEKLRNND